jgi:hypothetical protein
MITIERLKSAIEEAWYEETAYKPSLSAKSSNSRGQCVPTALVVQDYLGGDIQKLTTVFNNKEETHYRNILVDGSIIDLTISQYPHNHPLEVAKTNFSNYNSIREKLLANQDTLHRYNILKLRVKNNLYR